MTLSFRQMETGDLPSAFSVRLSTEENAITMAELARDYGVTPESLAEAMKSTVKGWLCEDGGAVVGFAMGDRSNGEVQVVAVLPDYEGRGIGRQLLGQVQSWLFSQGHGEIWLRANPDPHIRATGFYKKLGWRATGQSIGDDEVLTLRQGEANG